MTRSSSSGGFIVVAEDKETGRPVASAGLVIPREDAMSHVGDVGVSVAPEWQGRGLGTKLLGEVIRLARRLHLLKLVLSVSTSTRGPSTYRGRPASSPVSSS